MKKLIMAIVCLMTMISANAQWYRSGSRAGNRMASYAHSMKMLSIEQNARYEKYKNHISCGDISLDNEKTSFWDVQQGFAINVTFGSVYKGDKSHLYYGADFVIGGALIGITLSDTSEGDDYNLTTGFQFGYFIPLLKLGDKNNGRNGWGKALLISPLVEFNQILNIDGHHLHENDPHHNCKAWIDTSYTTAGETGFGAALLYRFGMCGNLILKATTTSVGASIGIGF